MKPKYLVELGTLSLFVIGSLTCFVGCGQNNDTIAPVAGVLTLDEKPLPNVEIVFAPIGSKDNPNPGPW